MSVNSKNDFLRFSANSMKELITRKLSEDTNFTDQIYEGSNLAILIDLISYMYQCLIYQLNNAAAESMFADTQIYENINRLVTLLGYNPKGCYPSTIQLQLQKKADTDVINPILYPYTRFSTNFVDSGGNRIYFSTRRNTDNYRDEMNFDNDSVLNVRFYNGTYRLYHTIFAASGTDNETFELDIGSNSSNNTYVPNDFIDVYVQNTDGHFEFWNYDSESIFNNSSNIADINTTTNTTIYGNDKSIYTLRLSNKKTYELIFGNGIIGRKLKPGDRVFIFYLDSNGPDGEIDLTDIDFSDPANYQLEHSPAVLGISDQLYNNLMNSIEGNINNPIDYTDEKNNRQNAANCCEVAGSVDNVVTKFYYEENVHDIKVNAPNWFKLGNRLITAGDYEYFIKNNKDAMAQAGIANVVDVKCMNNTKIASTFYKWLYLQGLNGAKQGLFDDHEEITYNTKGGNHYFRQEFWNRTDYCQIDPADANNTYLWIKTSTGDGQDERDIVNIQSAEYGLNNALNPLKTLTTEIKIMNPVIVYFDICANPNDTYIRDVYMNDGVQYFDEDLDTYIEITLDDNTIYVGSALKTQIGNIISNYFNVNRCVLGQNISYSDILQQIYNIPGIQRVRTIYKNKKDISQIRILDGLSFASWSPILNDNIAKGVDLAISVNGRHLEEFQFPKFIGRSTLIDRITLIKQSLTAINTIKM